MRILADKDNYIKGFIYDRQGQRIPLAIDEVVWFRNFNPLEEFAGLSPVAPLRMSVDMGYDALKSNRNLFKRGILMNNIMFQAADSTTDEEIADFEKRLQKRFAGPDNAHRPMVAAGIEPKNLGLNPKDMEHINTLRWSLEDVCRIYGVPKPLLSDLERATYSNIDAAERIFWRNTIVPQLQFLQEEINERFVKQFGDDLVAQFDLSEIEALQPDVNAVWERLRQNVGSGLMTINEARTDMSLEPVPWGDSWWAPLTLVPIQDEFSAGIGQPLEMSYRGNGHHRRWQPPMLSDANIQRFAEVHSKRLDRFQGRFDQMQQALFEAQRRDVIRRLSEHKALTKQGLGELFNVAEWIQLFTRSGNPILLASIIESAESQIELFGLAITFDVTNPAVQDWILKRIEFWANRVNQETAVLLGREIYEAQELGESIKQIQERVEKVFRFNSTVRSERIARTESQASLNKGALEAYRQSGVVPRKMWISVLDDRTREAHIQAHRQVVELDAKFSVGGELVDGPGEGSPENVINCRCVIGPVIEAGKAVYAHSRHNGD